MNEKTLRMLEYNKIIEKLVNNAITFKGKEYATSLLPSSILNKVEKKQKETTEAVSMLLRYGTPPIAPVVDDKEIINKVRIGGVLSIKSLLEMASALKNMREVKEYGKEHISDDNVILTEYFDSLYSNQNVEKEIFRCIKSEEELDDRASTELYSIRRHIADAEGKIKEKLNDIVHSSDLSKYLQDQVVTFRNDRYVIPVKQEYKNEIKGFIHDSSASGSTIFIEPTSVFNINNEIKELKIKEQLEIERILALLTQMLDPILEDIENSIETLGYIDFAFAKAKLSLSMKAFEPILNNKNYINLKRARHPLIPEKEVVPIDVWIGEKYRILVITGPNTGGKTVTLKTVGLLSLMAQSGLHIPASESSEICVFDNVYADIGDEQSIEQSLSTFSSHMKNVINITNNATNNDLVLVDELGSGTDPVEGAAIAMSVLEYLRENKITTIATTHYSELKTYAMQTNDVENASCEFNVETLKPTYKLLIGIPGRSNAFAISKKLGLSEKILNKANSYLSAETIRFEDVLNKMELDRIKAKEQKEYADKLLVEAKEEKEKAESEMKKLEDKKNEILQKAKKEARDLLLDAETEANEIIKELTNLKKSKSKNVGQSIQEARVKIKKSISEIQKDLTKPKIAVKNALKSEDIIVGMKVYVPSLDQEASIVTLPDKKGNVMIQSGLIKLNIHTSQLEKSKEENKKAEVKINMLVKNKARDISTEINLLGMTVDEAVNVLEKYLDDAYLSGLKQVRVVHGKGSGALRKGVQDYLRTNSHVSSFRLGMYGEGDSGVTIVEIK